ncbi:esterase/lipase family protein [Streptomyces sp. NRRL S-340]|uniref:esterase/lipase family protein n=1 Tax=Streptomyces sp. NRRL S-340 TaxID=1463901 RepID=UPI0005670C1F|nr:alpha/beta fold hydrolase [Streptomyces sp. NRRL S-340]
MRRLRTLLLAMLSAVALAAFGMSSTADAATSGRTPVVFVHDFTGNAGNWAAAEAVFEADGYSSGDLFAYQYNWTQSNATSAAGLAAYVRQVLATTGAHQVDIVNHSMGGLVSNWYIRKLGGQPYVRHLASIAGANHGTTAAGACLVNVSCLEMYPGSAFLSTLNAGDETPGDTQYATWYSPCDGVIIPYTSTPLIGAANHLVPCQTHLGFLTDVLTLQAVEHFLSS